MSETSSATSPPGSIAHVFPAEAIWVTAGAHQGDAIGPLQAVVLGDVYQLDDQFRAVPLALQQTGSGQTVGHGSGIGEPGDAVTLQSLLTLMSPDGEQVQVLIIRHDPSRRHFALPFSPLAPETDYTLLDGQADPGDVRLADIICVSLTAGTMITLPGGTQQSIESLEPGDKVLTRDHGAQPLRWIGKATLRALGPFAPVVIGAGTLGNEGDLVVSQHHRIFLYQRGQARIGRTAELLVQAKHLINGDAVWLREGGYVDYYSLVFDQHEIIYAAGIPCESLLVNEATLRHLPEDLAADVRNRFPGLSQTQHFGTEAGRDLLDDLGRDALFQRT